LLALLGLGSRPAHAQIPLDSIPPDSVPRDTVDETGLFLKAQANDFVRLPVLPLVGVGGPNTPGSRIVLERDSIEWSNAETISDLLQRVAGVYLWRGGWIGRPEYPDYHGRGPTSVEYYLDGLPYLAVGPDSLGIDPSLFALSILSRVEIERWPDQLRVYLFTRRDDRQSAVSRIGISAGDKSIARYVAALEKRYKNGIGFVLAGERQSTPTAMGTSSDFDITTAWLQASYVPSPRFGIQAQLFQSDPDRRPFVQDVDTLDQGLKGTRRDEQFRVFWRNRPDDLGLRVDLLAGQTTWSGTGVRDKVRQGGLVAAWRSPTIGIEARAFNRSRWTPWDLSAKAGWTPTAWSSVSAEAAYQTHDLARSSRWLGLRGGLQLPLGFDATGTLRTGRRVAAPALLKDRPQDLADWRVAIGWQRPFAGFEVGYERTAAYAPLAYRPFTPTVDSLRSFGSSNWITINWRLRPLQWMTFEGWYSDPRGPTPDGIPPTHSLSSATIRSRFLRSFPSGIFDLKLQGSIEAWGKGTIGLDSTGAVLPLRGATFFRSLLEIQLDRFIIYWDRVNLKATRNTYVPGFRILPFGSTFGVRWEFSN